MLQFFDSMMRAHFDNVFEVKVDELVTHSGERLAVPPEQ